MIWIVDTEGRIVGTADKEWGAVDVQLGPTTRERRNDHGRIVRIAIDLADGPVRMYDPKAAVEMVRTSVEFRVVRITFRDPSGYDRRPAYFPAYFLQVLPGTDLKFLAQSPFIDLRDKWGAQ